jgi:DNA-binding response OmpR family regulator
MRVLVVEDDPKAARLLARGLREDGFVVDLAASADDGEAKVGTSTYDVIVLDWLLPGKDGLTFCRELRQRDVATPILMLTARDGVADRVAGLNTGADDYLTKPFALEELLARIRALLRRSVGPRPVVLSVGELTLDPMSHRVTRAGVPINLTPKEYAILEVLMRYAGQVVTRARLAEQVWEAEPETLDSAVNVHVSHLRKKIGPEGALLRTVHGRGYCLDLPPR